MSKDKYIVVDPYLKGRVCQKTVISKDSSSPTSKFEDVERLVDILTNLFFLRDDRQEEILIHPQPLNNMRGMNDRSHFHQPLYLRGVKDRRTSRSKSFSSMGG